MNKYKYKVVSGSIEDIKGLIELNGDYRDLDDRFLYAPAGSTIDPLIFKNGEHDTLDSLLACVQVWLDGQVIRYGDYLVIRRSGRTVRYFKYTNKSSKWNPVKGWKRERYKQHRGYRKR